MKWASSLLSGKNKHPSPAKVAEQAVPRLPVPATISKENMVLFKINFYHYIYCIIFM